MPAAFAKHIRTVQVLVQHAEHGREIRTAALPGAQGQHPHAHLAQGVGRRGSRRSRRAEEDGLTGTLLEQMDVARRIGQARGQHAGQGLPLHRLAGDAGREAGVVGPEGAAAHQHGAPGTADAGTQAMHQGARPLAADPAGVAGTGGDAPVHGGGQLEDHIGAALLPGQEVGYLVAAFLLADRADDVHTGGAQAFGAARRLGGGIVQADDHPTDARGQHGFAAGRGLAVMVAGLQRDHQGALGGIDALTLRVAQAFHLGVGLPGGMVPAARHHPAVAHQHGAHRGIGAGAPAAVLGQGQGLTHERGKKGLRHAAVLWACRAGRGSAQRSRRPR